MHLRLLKPPQDEKIMGVQHKLLQLGIKVDRESGHLFYTSDFKPLASTFQLVFVRHGETFGNCGQINELGKIDYEAVKSGIKNSDNRIFQGNVDEDINQLTEFGKKQASDVAEKLKEELLKNNWRPDVIFHSPLSRAKETGLPFVTRNELEQCYFPLEGIREMAFGLWDNRRVCDFEEKDPCHSFYREQHGLIKKSGVNGTGMLQVAENFCEVLLRARDVLVNLEKDYSGKKIIMFSHSMFGAACSILYGRGRQFENEAYLAFDGKSKDGEHYVMPNATPVFLNFPKPDKLTMKLVFKNQD